MINFDSKQIIKSFLTELPDRSQDILAQRYGLGNQLNKLTLEAIGQKYGITRERVRQIENHSLKGIRKSESFGNAGDVFNELSTLIELEGGVVVEDNLLDYLSKDKLAQNNLYFLLVLGDAFTREKSDDEFKARWFVDREKSNSILGVLKDIHKNFDEADKLITEEEILSLVRQEIKKRKDIQKAEERHIKNWLSLSKKIDKNPFDEWGLATSQNIKLRGIRSYSYLVARQNGSPMHFTEVAEMIKKCFDKKVHIATCHNELIKDKRFVLVGRGLYALAEWGYSQGIVRDVVRDILEKNGPLTKKEVVDKVLKERYVKENTVIVNLQNPNFFNKNSDGTYSII
ncbi:MAG: sigma factor-like helix-turn-helix DNA-binding protein [Patescibacteria group bacterium]